MYDIAFFIILGIAAVRGFLKSFSYELFSLCTVVLGFVITFFTSGFATGWLISKGFSGEFAYYAAPSVIFLLALIVVMLAGRIFFSYSKIKSLGLLDNLLGTITSVLKYAIVICAAIYFFRGVNPLHTDAMESSRMYRGFYNVAVSVHDTFK